MVILICLFLFNSISFFFEAITSKCPLLPKLRGCLIVRYDVLTFYLHGCALLFYRFILCFVTLSFYWHVLLDLRPPRFSSSFWHFCKISGYHFDAIYFHLFLFCFKILVVAQKYSPLPIPRGCLMKCFLLSLQ